MRTGNWGHGKHQAVPTVSSYTVMVRDKMTMESVEKRRFVALPNLLAQEQMMRRSVVRVAAANCCNAKAQDTYEELNRVDGVGYPFRCACLQLLHGGMNHGRLVR